MEGMRTKQRQTQGTEMEQRAIHSSNSRDKDQGVLHIKMGLESHRVGASAAAGKVTGKGKLAQEVGS